MAERAPGRRPHAGARHPGFGRDDRGQLLILTGVLLVLGFVIIGSTMVQLQSIDESTSRLQRDALLDPVDVLVANFNQTVRDSVLLGHTNTTDFKAVMLMVEDRIRDAATRSGLYIAADLHPDPPPEIFWRDSRCGGYNPGYTTDGIIIGYEESSETETIAGAVYNLHITDGRQTIRMPYYVRIYQCMVKEQTVFVDIVASPEGTHSADWTPARTVDGLTAQVAEEISGYTYTARTAEVDQNAISAQSWDEKSKIQIDDNDYARHTNTDANHYIQWYFVAPSGFTPGEEATNLKLKINHYHVQGLTNDDVIKVEVRNGAFVRTWSITANTTEGLTNIVVGNSPSGNPYWTHAEITGSTWKYYVDEFLTKDLNRRYYIDYVRLAFNERSIQGHHLEATFDWPSIPAAYEAHTVHMRYRWDQKTVGESLRMEVWDYVSASWDARPAYVYSFVATGPAGWQDATLALDPDAHRGPSNMPKLRITDSNAADGLVTDLDTLLFDQLVIKSTVAAP